MVKGGHKLGYTYLMSRYEVANQEQHAHDDMLGNGDYVGT